MKDRMELFNGFIRKNIIGNDGVARTIFSNVMVCEFPGNCRFVILANFTRRWKWEEEEVALEKQAIKYCLEHIEWTKMYDIIFATVGKKLQEPVLSILLKEGFTLVEDSELDRNENVFVLKKILSRN